MCTAINAMCNVQCAMTVMCNDCDMRYAMQRPAENKTQKEETKRDDDRGLARAWCHNENKLRTGSNGWTNESSLKYTLSLTTSHRQFVRVSRMHACMHVYFFQRIHPPIRFVD